eukprot:3328716-Rhodomonas_salina.1
MQSCDTRIKELDSVVHQIFQKIISRLQSSKEKHGTDHTDLDSMQWIDHAIEEQLDDILYLQKLRHELYKESREHAGAHKHTQSRCG